MISVVSLNRPMNVFIVGGITSFRACGRTIKSGLLPVRHAHRIGRFELSLRQCLQAAADDFGDVGGGKQREADERAKQLVEVHALGQEQRDHQARHEQDRDQRHAAHRSR